MQERGSELLRPRVLCSIGYGWRSFPAIRRQFTTRGRGRATATKGCVRSRYSRPRRAGPRSIPAEIPGKPLPRIPPCHYLPGASVDWVGGNERRRTDPSCRRL